MKTDSIEFKKRLEEVRARAENLDQLRLAVIKWHLLVEGALDEFLTASVFHAEHLKVEQRNFHVKGELALSPSAKEDKDPWWAVFWALNQLRNKIAHRARDKEIDEKVQYLRKTFIDALESNQKADAERLANPELIEEAGILVMGFLAQLKMHSEARRAVSDKQ
jgi:hypothetical protein